MIQCVICGDVCGPWAFVEHIGFVCEDCEENGKLSDLVSKLEVKPEETKENIKDR